MSTDFLADDDIYVKKSDSRFSKKRKRIDAKRMFAAYKRSCNIHINKILMDIDTHLREILSTSDNGNILPRKITHACCKLDIDQKNLICDRLIKLGFVCCSSEDDERTYITITY